jgi:hypothetical protein
MDNDFTDFVFKFWHLFFKVLLMIIADHYQMTQMIQLTGLTQPHFCACPKPGPGFLTSYVMVFSMFSE